MLKKLLLLSRFPKFSFTIFLEQSSTQNLHQDIHAKSGSLQKKLLCQDINASDKENDLLKQLPLLAWLHSCQSIELTLRLNQLLRLATEVLSLNITLNYARHSGNR